MSKKTIPKEIRQSILAIALAAAYPWVFLYSVNIKEVTLASIALPYLIFAAIGIALAAVMCLFRVPIAKAGCLSAIFLFLFSIYGPIENAVIAVLPVARYWHVLPTVLILFGIFAWWFACKASEVVTDIVKMIVPLIFGILVAMNLVTAIPAGIQKMNIGEKEPQKIVIKSAQTGGAQANHPNIYLMIFDEYASFHQLETYYGFDNREFKTFLEDRGFMVSMNSRNECSSTEFILTNMLSLEYIADSHTTSFGEMKRMRENPYLLRLLTENQYTLNGVGNTTWLSTALNGTDDSKAKGPTSIEGFTLETLFVQNSMVYVLAQDQAFRKRDEKNHIFASIIQMAKDPNTQQFTLSYVASPHPPFLFDKDGGAVSQRNWMMWENKNIYLGQLQYVNSKIQAAVDNILTRDPDSVIIICSDHGARGDKSMNFPIEERARILMACYFCGERYDELLDLSGVNTLRTVVNLLGLDDLELLEVPYAY